MKLLKLPELWHLLREMDLEAVRRDTEHDFGVQVVGEATWRVTRRRGWWGRRVVWTPLCGPPLVAKRALWLASQQAQTLGHGQVRPEHLLLGGAQLGAEHPH